jgi:asparagine synthase (glutamine-hydrolysing)
MSGLCGIVHFDGKPLTAESLRSMANAASYRGPDGINYWSRNGAGFAHLALHVTPESVRERQPLDNGDLVLTADARIDNRDDLILRLGAYLQEKGPTDAELILAAYRRWGDESPAYLIGDFSFAIWDQRRRRLFAARDPMAMRAFYYRVEPNRLLFATEIKQLLALTDVPAELFEPAVAAHLAGVFGPLDWTFYRGINQLSPAHVLVVDAQSHRTWRYWDIDPEYRLEYREEAQYAEHFRELFKESVRCRLRSVKPVGIFLSGGVDSGAIASTAGWLMRQGFAKPPAFRAYCWAFDSLPQCDERHISRGITEHYGFPSTDIPVDEACPLMEYPKHGPDRDEPYIGVYQALIERTLDAARADGVALMLSGDRGDLVSGGWVLDYLSLLRARRWRDLWSEFQTQSRLSGASLSRVVAENLYTVLPALARHRLRRVVRARPAIPRAKYPGWLDSSFAKRVDLAEIARRSGIQPKVDGYSRRMRYEYIFTLMHMRGMVWSERTYAKFGQCFADPWSDRRIASFALAVPQQVLNRPGELNKRLVRQAMQGIMPEPVRQAARKIVPSPVYQRALKEQAKDTVRMLIRDSRAALHGYIDEKLFGEHYEALLNGGRQHHCFWWTLTLEMWLRECWPGHPVIRSP